MGKRYKSPGRLPTRPLPIWPLTRLPLGVPTCRAVHAAINPGPKPRQKAYSRQVGSCLRARARVCVASSFLGAKGPCPLPTLPPTLAFFLSPYGSARPHPTRRSFSYILLPGFETSAYYFRFSNFRNLVGFYFNIFFCPVLPGDVGLGGLDIALATHQPHTAGTASFGLAGNLVFRVQSGAPACLLFRLSQALGEVIDPVAEVYSEKKQGSVAAPGMVSIRPRCLIMATPPVFRRSLGALDSGGLGWAVRSKPSSAPGPAAVSIRMAWRGKSLTLFFVLWKLPKLMAPKIFPGSLLSVGNVKVSLQNYDFELM